MRTDHTDDKPALRGWRENVYIGSVCAAALVWKACIEIKKAWKFFTRKVIK